MVKYDSQISILFFDFSLVFQAKVKIWGTFQPSILCPIKVGYCRFARFQQKYFTYFQAEKQIPFMALDIYTGFYVIIQHDMNLWALPER